MVTRLVAIGLALAPVVAAAQPPGVARPPIRIVAPAAGRRIFPTLSAW